jgi:hypothetical protein
MISIHSTEENEFVTNYVKKQPSYSANVWIGMKRNITQGFQWINKSPFDYSKWARNQPDNWGGYEPNVEILINDYGFWNDCHYAYNAFICEINYNNE